MRESAYKVFIRSRLTYQMVPMVAAGIINIEGVLEYQRQLLRKFLQLPRDIKGKAITNIVLSDRKPLQVLL